MMKRMSNRVSKRFAEFDQGDPTQGFELLDCLGEGTYGSVWSAQDHKAKKKTAVKIVPIDNDLDEIKAEIAIMRDSESDFIVKLFSAYVSADKTHIWMSMEVCEAGSVNDLMFVTDETLSVDQLRDVTAASALGLAYLHKKFIIHRDIKCGNILLNARGQCKLADFGVSAVLKSKSDRTTTAIGAPFWMAPECISELPYDGRADVWSLGITVIEMAESRPPNSHIHPMRALFVIPHQPAPTLTDPNAWPDEMVNFVTRCLTKKMEDRWTSKEMTQHAFLQKSCKELQRNKGCSRRLEQLVKKHLPAIEQFRNLDDDSSEDGDDESFMTDTMDSSLGPKSASSRPPPAPAAPQPSKHGSVQTFYMLGDSDDEDEESGSSSSARQATGRPASSASSASSLRFAPPRHQNRASTSSFVEVNDRSAERRATAGAPRAVVPSERRHQPIRPATLEKSTLKLKAATLTQSRKLSARQSVSKRFSRGRLSSRKLSTAFGESILPKGEQNRMSTQDVKKILATPDADRQSVRKTAPGAGQEDYGSMVMTKQFIALLKKSKSEAPDLFEAFQGADSPEDVLSMAIKVLNMAVKSSGPREPPTTPAKFAENARARPAPRAPP